MLACKGCGHKFEVTAKEHYIARDDTPGGLIAPPEMTLYDAFDCPVCGCQIIVQERKRAFQECKTKVSKEENKK